MDKLPSSSNQGEIAMYRAGNLVSINTRESSVFDAWREMPDAIIPASAVRTLTKAVFVQTLRFRDWLKPQVLGIASLYDMCRTQPAKDYYFEGLQALGDLFSDETYDRIQFRSITAFPQLSKYPGVFHFGDEACTFNDWQKGYLLSLIRFGEAHSGSSSSRKILSAHSNDLEFVKRFLNDARRGRRDMVGVLKAFAWMWDVFFIPLRYFNGQAAMDFSREWLGYSGNDLRTFRRIFYGGGSPKEGRGLKLKPVSPSVVRQWSDRTIIINCQATAQNGFNMRSLSAELERLFKRRVTSR
jgi:hypothetical protein